MSLIKETQAMRDLNDCMGSLFEKSAEIRRLTAENKVLRKYIRTCDLQAAEIELASVSARHVTTGDVRLELGWTQEECDEADSVAKR